jgi:hypothetical protein
MAGELDLLQSVHNSVLHGSLAMTKSAHLPLRAQVPGLGV